MIPSSPDQTRGDDPVRELFWRWGLRAGRVTVGWTVRAIARGEAGAAFADFSSGAKQVRFWFRRAGTSAHALRVGAIEVGHDALGTELDAEVRPLFGLVVAMLKRHDAGADLTPLLADAPTGEATGANDAHDSERHEGRFTEEIVRIERHGGGLHVQLLRGDDVTVLLQIAPSGCSPNACARTPFGDVSYSRFSGISERGAAAVARRYASLLGSHGLPWAARFPHLLGTHPDAQRLMRLLDMPSAPAMHAVLRLDPEGVCALLVPEIVPDGSPVAQHVLRAVHWLPERGACQLDFVAVDSSVGAVAILVGPRAALPDAFAVAGALAVEISQEHPTLTDADAQLAARLTALLCLKQRRDFAYTVPARVALPSIPAGGVPSAAAPRAPVASQPADWRHFADVLQSIGAFRSAANLGDRDGVSGAERDSWTARLHDERQRFAAEIARNVRAEWHALEREQRLREGAELPELAMPRDYGDAMAAVAALERTMPDGGRGRVLEDMYLDSIPRKWVRQLAVSAPENVRLLHTPFDWNRLPRLRRMIECLYTQIAQAGGSVRTYLGAADASSFFAAARTVAQLYDGSYWSRFMPLQDLSPTELAAVAPLLARDTPEAVADRYLSSALFHDLSHGRSTRVALFPPNLDECITAYLGVRAAPNLLLAEPGEDNALQEFGWYAQVGQALARTVGCDRLIRAYTGVETWSAVLSPALSRTLVRLGWDDYFHYRDLSFHSLVYRPDPWLKLFFLAGAGLDLDGLDLAQLELLPWTEIPSGSPEPLDEEILRDGLRAMCVRHYLDGDWLRVGRRIPQSTIEIDVAACRMTTDSDPDAADPAPPAYFIPPAIAARLRADGIGSIAITLRDLAAIPEIVANVIGGHAVDTAAFAIEPRSCPVAAVVSANA